MPSAPGLFFFGTGNTSVTLSPGCDLQVLPILPFFISFGADGAGSVSLPATIPYGTANTQLYLQALLLDPGLPLALSGTNAMEIDIQ